MKVRDFQGKNPEFQVENIVPSNSVEGPCGIGRLHHCGVLDETSGF